MVEKSKSTRFSQSPTDVLIGEGVRVEGNITFSGTGVLRIHGDVLGDVSCGADTDGTIVVGESGNVTGTINAPHIVVGGRVNGPVRSSESIEIQEGAHVSGDAYYKVIDIHAGGVIEGSLTPMVPMDTDQAPQGDRIQNAQRPAVKEYGMPRAGTVPAGRRFRGARTLGGAVVLLVAAVAIVYANREPTRVASSATEVAPNAASFSKEVPVVQAAPVVSDGQEASKKVAAEGAVPLPPNPDAISESPVQASSSNPPETDQENVVRVQGVNPGKPANVFLVISKSPSVLYEKKLQDPGDGKRMDLPQGTTESIAIAKDEIFRIASGRDIQMYYQGRKVASKTIASGAWISFVPLTRSGAMEKQ